VSVSREHVAQVLLLGHLGDVGDTQGSAVVAVELAAHLLASAGAATQMRGHVAALAGAEATSTAGRIVGHIRGSICALGGHGVLEGALCGEVVAGADTALDLCVLELELLLLVVALVLGASLPVGDGAEVDVLCDADGVGLGAGSLALFLAELGPALALCDARVDDLLDDRLLDAARCLNLLAVLANVVRRDGLGSVLVLGDLLGRELLLDVAIFLLFGPVGAAVRF
jgi:hypothetical protein